MKTLQTVALVAALTLSQAAFGITEGEYELCAKIENISSGIMKHRQNRVSLKTLLEALKGHEHAVSITLEAYRHPVYSTSKYKLSAIKDFANKHYVRCLTVYTD